MDPITSVLEKVKSLAKSSQNLLSNHLSFNSNPSHHNPIDILKRLQREAFSEIMKLRDRQDKVERIISSYNKTSKGNPFQETNTHFKGQIDGLGAMQLIGNTNEESLRPKLLSRFTFETRLRENDKLVTELVAGSQKNELSLAKVCYKGEINEWLSVIAIPVGAYFRDVDSDIVSSYEGMSLAEVSELGPPLLNRRKGGSVVGLTLRNSNVVASMAHSMSNGSFGKVSCDVINGVKVSLLGCHQRLTLDDDNRRCVALKLDSLIDESMRIGGWIEIEKWREEKEVKWSVSITDKPEDEVGWGMSVGGVVDGVSRNRDRFEFESFLKFNVDDRFSVSPGLVYVSNCNGRNIGVRLQSHWSL